MDDIQREMMLEEWRRTGSLSRAARRLGLDYHSARQQFPEAITEVIPQRPATIPSRSDFRMPQYIVSVKWAYGGWPDGDAEAIAQARRDYNAGTHEMCQGRSNSWVILYSIPRLVRTPYRDFFCD